MALYGKRSKSWLWLVPLFLLIIFHLTGVLSPLENLAIKASSPLAGFLYNKGSQARSSYENTQKKDVFAELAASQQEISRLTVQNANYKELEEENVRLKAQLAFLSINKYKNVMANVISQDLIFDIKEGDQDIVIDKGLKDGIREGLGVINENGVIIGKVIEARDSLSKVCLTTNRNCKFAATIQNQERTMGITEGDLGLTIKMNFIPQSDKIAVGDTVITSGLSGNIPRGLVIGKVGQVNNQSNEIWQDVNIEPLLNLNTLTIVSVLIP